MSQFLRRNSFMLPLLDEEGNSLSEQHKGLALELLEDFGQFHRTSRESLWMHPETKEIVAEDVVEYSVLIDFSDGYKFRRLAIKYGELCNQTCVYHDADHTTSWIYMSDHKQKTGNTQ